jgi:hypothetical protein
MPAPKVDILVNLLTQLQPDPAITTIPLNDADQPLDYSRLIGNKVIQHDTNIAQLISSLNSLYSTVTSLNTSVNNLYTAVDPVPDFAFPGIMGDLLVHPIEDITLAIGNQLLSLENGTGDSTSLISAVLYQNQLYSPSTLASQPPLYASYSTMADIPNWVVSPANIADTVKNLWITVNDMRNAMDNYLTVRGVTSCTAVNVNFTAIVDISLKRIILYFVGNCTIPNGFRDVNSVGGSLAITDGSASPNTFTVNVNVSEGNQNTNGVIIDLTSTNINLFTTLSLQLTYSLTNDDLVCSGVRTVSVLSRATPCVAGSLYALSTTSFTGVYQLQNANQVVTYKLETFTNPTCTTLVSGSTQLFINPTNPTINYTIESGLTTGTTYYVKMAVSIGGLTYTNCPVQSVQTL